MLKQCLSSIYRLKTITNKGDGSPILHGDKDAGSRNQNLLAISFSKSMTKAQHNSLLTAAPVMKMRPRPRVGAGFSCWHARMSTAPASVVGFVSGEVNAPPAGRGPEVARRSTFSEC